MIIPGKFDALHVGHRHLAQQASQHGSPVLLSFSGMAARLQWRPRAPLVAPSDRDRILRQWRNHLGSAVAFRTLSFDGVAHMEPTQFLEMLKRDFDAGGVVCGPDWRFGKGASGDVNLLQCEGERLNLKVVVADSIMVGDTVASSTRVREALMRGDVAMVAELLGRLHRVVGGIAYIEDDGVVVCEGFVNQVPGYGLYEAVVRVLGRSEPIRTKVQVRNENGQDRILVFEREQAYCAECEIYVDFVDKLV